MPRQLFKPGNTMSKGRPPGTPNRRTTMIEETADRLGCDPFEVLLMFAKGDWQGLGYDASVIIKESKEGSSTFMEYTISPELRFNAAKEASTYLYAKRKSIELTTPSPIEGMTPREKLEAMKQAVAMLEGQIDQDESNEDEA